MVEIIESFHSFFIAIYLAGGIFCLIRAYELDHYVKTTMNYGHETTGKVVEIVNDHWNNSKEKVIIEYDTSGGVFRHVTMSYPKPSPYKVGQSVVVWLRPYRTRYSGQAALADENPGRLPFFLFVAGALVCLFMMPEMIIRIIALWG